VGITVVAALEDTILIKPRATRRLPECDRCLLYANEPFIVCAVHPYGPEGDSCLDFRSDPEMENKRFVDFLGLQQRQEDTTAEELYSNSHDLDPDGQLWEPEGVSYYNGELILQSQPRWTQEEQLELLDTHPLFTGKCPQCSAQYDRSSTARVHWDCPICGWMDDTV